MLPPADQCLKSESLLLPSVEELIVPGDVVEDYEYDEGDYGVADGDMAAMEPMP